ncbi:unnamed protein product [Rotaria socialis]|nr:unnamed protein product [Rotaria socialis]
MDYFKNHSYIQLVSVLDRCQSQLLTFATIQTFPISSGFHPDSIVIGDFNKDNILDVAIADSENNNIPVLHGSSNGTLTTRETHSTGANSTPMVLAEGDFNNDQ